MEKKNLSKAWKSQFYSSVYAHNWFYLFQKAHPRATRYLLNILGKTITETIHLAQFSQIGWEWVKQTVKSLEKLGSFEKVNISRIVIPELHGDVISTIQTLSSKVVFFTEKYKYVYPAEVLYLTKWFKKLL